MWQRFEHTSTNWRSFALFTRVWFLSCMCSPVLFSELFHVSNCTFPVNLMLHVGHSNGFSSKWAPSCILSCVSNCSLPVKLMLHVGHSNGFSSVWALIGSSSLVNVLLQDGHANSFSPVCSFMVFRLLCISITLFFSCVCRPLVTFRACKWFLRFRLLNKGKWLVPSEHADILSPVWVPTWSWSPPLHPNILWHVGQG